MFQLNESLKVKNNRLYNIPFHNERLNNASKKLFQVNDTWDLAEIIKIPDLNPEQIYKCRVIYGMSVESIEFIPYVFRNIRYLKLVESCIDYTYKYSDRQSIDELKKNAVNSDDTDIIIVKNGCITDTSFSNILFFDGNKWVTPDTPLLKGTKRAFYLANKTIIEKKITVNDIHAFQKVRLINAMIDMEDALDISLENIY